MGLIVRESDVNPEAKQRKAERRVEVELVDISVPVGRLMVLLVKLAIAAIPAAIIIGILWAFIGLFFVGM